MTKSAAFEALLYIETRIRLEDEDLEGNVLHSMEYMDWKKMFVEDQEKLAAHKLVIEEKAQWDCVAESKKAKDMYTTLNDEQKELFDAVMSLVSNAKKIPFENKASFLWMRQVEQGKHM